MRQPRSLALALVLTLIAGLSVATTRAADSDQEKRLRDALRAAVTQQRALEDERAVLQAKAAESERQIAALRARIEQLLKQAEQSEAGATKQAEREKAVTQLNERISAQNESIRSLRSALEKESKAHKTATADAGNKEAERVKLAGEAAELTRRVESCEVKNVGLFQVGSEVLDRFEKVDLGDVLATREPFIGIKRVELENLVQDYRDKLLDQKVTP